MIAPGVSSTIRSTPVASSSARMLRPSRPMMRPFRSSLGRSTTETVVSIACSAAAALNGLGDVVLGAVGGRLARLGVEPLEQVGGVVARVGLHLLDEQLLGLVGRQAGDAFELALLLGDELLVLRRGRRATPSRARSTARSRAVSSFSSRSTPVCAIGERGVAPRERLLERRRLLALLPRLALGLHEDLVRLLLGLEQRFLLAGFGVALGVLDDAERPALRRGRRFRRRCACGWPPTRRSTAAAATRRRRTMSRSSIGNTRDVLSTDRAWISRRDGTGRTKKGPALPCGEVDEPA